MNNDSENFTEINYITFLPKVDDEHGVRLSDVIGMGSSAIISDDIADPPVMKQMDDNQGLMIIHDTSQHCQTIILPYNPNYLTRNERISIKFFHSCCFYFDLFM